MGADIVLVKAILGFFLKTWNQVRRMIGHKSILYTQLYVNMEKVFFNESTEEYTDKVASNIEEFCKLIEVSFKLVTEMEGKNIQKAKKMTRLYTTDGKHKQLFIKPMQ